MLFLLLLLVNDLRLIRETYPESENLLILSVAYFTAFLSTILLIFSRKKWIRRFIMVLLLSAVFTDVVFILLTGFPFSCPDAINIFNNTEYASGTIVTFGTAFFIAFIFTGLVFMVLYYGSYKPEGSFSGWWLILFLSVPLGVYGFNRNGQGFFDYLPHIFRITGNLTTASLSHEEQQWNRSEVTAKSQNQKIKHLILIVDESISGSALSLNGAEVLTTPFLGSVRNRIYNFGIAASFTNYSAGSNIALLSGLQYAAFPDKKFSAFKKPSLYQFARSAGYKTFLLDGQAPEGKLQNYTTEKDRQFIDSVFKVEKAYSGPDHSKRDSVIARKIIEIISSGTPSFVYVNKAGAHWPYQTNYPEDSARFTGIQEQISERRNVVRYFESVYWNVDRFWKLLFNGTQGKTDFMIVYTSDHGENYNSISFKTKHASVYNADPEEGRVPLFIYGKSKLIPADFRPEKNTATHAGIFPTILVCMGYERLYVRKEYGPWLFENQQQKDRWFFTGDIFGRGRNKKVLIR